MYWNQSDHSGQQGAGRSAGNTPEMNEKRDADSARSKKNKAWIEIQVDLSHAEQNRSLDNE